jgi:hypothetical protein
MVEQQTKHGQEECFGLSGSSSRSQDNGRALDVPALNLQSDRFNLVRVQFPVDGEYARMIEVVNQSCVQEASGSKLPGRLTGTS